MKLRMGRSDVCFAFWPWCNWFPFYTRADTHWLCITLEWRALPGGRAGSRNEQEAKFLHIIRSLVAGPPCDAVLQKTCTGCGVMTSCSLSTLRHNRRPHTFLLVTKFCRQTALHAYRLWPPSSRFISSVTLLTLAHHISGGSCYFFCSANFGLKFRIFLVKICWSH